MDDGVFENCKNLQYIKIGNGLECVPPLFRGDSVQRGGSKSLVSVELGNIRVLWPRAFEGCVALKSISLPNTIESICELAFHECRSLETITIPKSVKKMGDGVFCSCDNLKSIKLDGVEELPNLFGYINVIHTQSISGKEETYIVNGSKKLSFVEIGSKIKKIPEKAFDDCPTIKEVKIAAKKGDVDIAPNAFNKQVKIKFTM
jgi:hypothetical protein